MRTIRQIYIRYLTWRFERQFAKAFSAVQKARDTESRLILAKRA